MGKNELLRATLESGVEPIEIRYVPVMSTSTRKPFAYRTVLQLNTQSLGVLLPADYEPVASRTVQCLNLALTNITDIAETITHSKERGIKADWFSAACPVRMLIKGSAAKLLSEHFEEIEFPDPSKLCLEFPSQVLFEDRDKAAKELSSLKFMGVKTILTGFGDEYCPTLRLAGFPFDYVILDKSVSDKMASQNSARSTSALIAYIRGLGIEVIADGAKGNELISDFYRSDCQGYIPEPGKLLTEAEALPDRR
jgi:EAL domain-containing protein (putative c-di-GMP-specific phosphodiesterase class I)